MKIDQDKAIFITNSMAALDDMVTTLTASKMLMSEIEKAIDSKDPAFIDYVTYIRTNSDFEINQILPKVNAITGMMIDIESFTRPNCDFDEDDIELRVDATVSQVHILLTSIMSMIERQVSVNEDLLQYIE